MPFCLYSEDRFKLVALPGNIYLSFPENDATDVGSRVINAVVAFSPPKATLFIPFFRIGS